MKLSVLPVSASLLATTMVCLLLACLAFPASAGVYHSKESALRLAFPDADSVESQQLFLSEDEVASVQKQSGCKLPSRLVTVYEGSRNRQSMGWAFLETHRVRTLPETVMVVLRSDGSVGAVHMLAFHEPKEYEPPRRWMEQFEGRILDEELWPGRSIAGIAGSTLSATALSAAIRRVLAIHQVKLRSSSHDTPLAGGVDHERAGK